MYYQDQMHAGSSCVRLWNVPLNRPVTSQLSGWMEWIMHRWSAPQQSTSERVTWPSVVLESAVVINKGFTKGGKLSGGPGQPGYSEPLSQYFKYFMLRIMSSCSEPRYHQTDGLTDWRTDGRTERGRTREAKKKTTHRLQIHLREEEHGEPTERQSSAAARLEQIAIH